jgi:prevent-host-death family protein
MKVANTVELKNKTNRILREVMRGEAVIITYRGKPAASLIALTEDDLEDFVLEHSPRIKKMIAQAEEARQKGEVIPLITYLLSRGQGNA